MVSSRKSGLVSLCGWERYAGLLTACWPWKESGLWYNTTFCIGDHETPTSTFWGALHLHKDRMKKQPQGLTYVIDCMDSGLHGACLHCFLSLRPGKPLLHYGHLLEAISGYPLVELVSLLSFLPASPLPESSLCSSVFLYCSKLAVTASRVE